MMRNRNPWSSFWSMLKGSAKRWNDTQAPTMGAALAYYTVFSIAPLLLIAIAIAGAVFGPEAARGELFASIHGMLGSDGARTVEELVENAGKQESSSLLASIAGIVTLLIGASTVFAQLQSSLNRIWDVPPEVTSGVKGFVRDRLLSFAMVASIAFLLLVSLIVSTALAAVGKYMSGKLPGGEALWRVINMAVSFGIVTALFASIFRVLPDAKVQWKDTWLGAAFTSLLFVLGRTAIDLYLGKTGVTSGFGAAGSLVALLVWVYWSAQILLFGAAFTREHAEKRGAKLEFKGNRAEAGAPRAAA